MNVQRKRSWSKTDEPPQTTSESDVHQKGLCCQYDGFTREFWISAAKQNNWHLHILVTTNQIERCLAAKTSRIGKPKCCISFNKICWNLIGMSWLYPPYSPNIAPSEYHLLNSLQYSLDRKTSTSSNNIKTYLEEFFAESDQPFYGKGIIKLPEK